MSETYRRPILRQQRTETYDTNSQFITTVARAETPESAREFIRSIREEFADASHNVYAFRAGYGNSITEGMSDDGEPSGTSGPPTLAVLRGSDIGDIVLVTTRYFGGTKLGTGGLVRAYTYAAQVALESLETEIKAPKVQIGIEIPYHLYEIVKRELDSYEITVDDESFAAEVTIIATVLAKNIDEINLNLSNISSGQIEVVELQKIDS